MALRTRARRRISRLTTSSRSAMRSMRRTSRCPCRHGEPDGGARGTSRGTPGVLVHGLETPDSPLIHRRALTRSLGTRGTSGVRGWPVFVALALLSTAAQAQGAETDVPIPSSRADVDCGPDVVTTQDGASVSRRAPARRLATVRRSRRVRWRSFDPERCAGRTSTCSAACGRVGKFAVGIPIAAILLPAGWDRLLGRRRV